ncbi:ATP-binding protein [Streptomyces sp. NPDC059452]|uniref:ATP-binding protein n=1 Tax=Streptomyces sp. NPDC059452 TaxID=3346835 RepID=UPI0036BB6F6E
MTGQEPPYQAGHVRFVDQLSLVAAQSAVPTSRRFLRLALSKWQAALIEDDVLLIASELVTNAITVTGPGVLPEPPTWGELGRLGLVHLRLVGLRDSVVVEVWDVSDEPPVLKHADDDAEGGRGLVLVQELAARWGSYRTAGGKVVWAELAARPDVAFLKRVLVGLDSAL